jgi:hypothetical protein
LEGETDFVFVDPPLPQAGIVLGQENHVQIDSGFVRQCIKHWNTIGRDDFSENN